jgi:hypothetical protein
VISHIKDLNCCKEFETYGGLCSCDRREIYDLKARITKALREDPELSIFEHVITPYAIAHLRPNEQAISIASSQLKFAIATRLLIESGLVGFKTTHIHIGRVIE